MSDFLKFPPIAISAYDANIRWQQSLELSTTFAQIWIQNPQLARQAGRRVEEYVMPLSEVQLRHFDDLN